MTAVACLDVNPKMSLKKMKMVGWVAYIHHHHLPMMTTMKRHLGLFWRRNGLSKKWLEEELKFRISLIAAVDLLILQIYFSAESLQKTVL
ncbi:hypothetical protein DMENIID0001_042630 [Sergentomyia squamirostris]